MKVSVAMITYNQKAYVAQAVESVLQQECTFDYELVIGEDRSTDGTREIVEEFARCHPGRIRLLDADENLGAQRNLARVLEACTGEYVAWLDGDDYWTSPSKLQRQADYLDEHPGCALCCHNICFADESGALSGPVLAGWPERSGLTDLLAGENFIASCSVMYRWGCVGALPEWWTELWIGDLPLHVMHARHGWIGYLDDAMAAYRFQGDGLWSRRDAVDRAAGVVSTLRVLDAHLGHEYHDLIQRRIFRVTYSVAGELLKAGRREEAGPFVWWCAHHLEWRGAIPWTRVAAYCALQFAPWLRRAADLVQRGKVLGATADDGGSPASGAAQLVSPVHHAEQAPGPVALLAYTENYYQGVGGASFVADLINGLAPLYGDVVLASNAGGLPPDTLPRLVLPARSAIVPILTSASVWNSWQMVFSHRATALLVNAVRALDPMVFEFNVAVCRRVIRHAQPSAVLGYNGGYPAARSVLAMVVAAHREEVPVALTVVSMPTRRRRALRRYEAWLDRRVGASVDAVIVNAEAIGNALVALRGLPADRVHLVRNGLPDEAHRAGMRHDCRVRIGFVSRMEATKGTVDLVNAFAVVGERHPDVELVLVGDGPERSHVEAAVQRHGLGSRVIFTGHYLGDLAELVATFDIYAFPSHWEGLPYALLEGMRAGCAMVSTDVGGIPEAITDELDGLLVRPGAVSELAAALERLVNDAELRAALGSAARRRFEEQFSLEVTHRQIRAAFGGAKWVAVNQGRWQRTLLARRVLEARLREGHFGGARREYLRCHGAYYSKPKYLLGLGAMMISPRLFRRWSAALQVRGPGLEQQSPAV